jgi:hypothetical protein
VPVTVVDQVRVKTEDGDAAVDREVDTLGLSGLLDDEDGRLVELFRGGREGDFGGEGDIGAGFEGKSQLCRTSGRERSTHRLIVASVMAFLRAWWTWVTSAM